MVCELHLSKKWFTETQSSDEFQKSILMSILGPLTLSWKIPSSSLLPKNKAYLSSTPSNVLPSPSTHPRGHSVSSWLQKSVQAIPMQSRAPLHLKPITPSSQGTTAPLPAGPVPPQGLPLTTHMILSKANGLTNSQGPLLCLPLITHCSAEQPDLKPILYDVSLSQSSLAHFPFWVVIHSQSPGKSPAVRDFLL